MPLTPSEFELQERGLRILAGIIARAYARDIEVVRETDREPANRHRHLRVTDSQFQKVEPDESCSREIGGEESES